jgi:hypothetical protein
MTEAEEIIEAFKGVSKPDYSDTVPVMDKRSKKDGYETVFVDTKKFDSAWKEDKSFYIGLDGEGGIGKRYDGFLKFIDTHDTFEQSVVGFDIYNKRPSFIDGRHRFAVLRDLGMKKIPVSVDPDSLEQIQKLYT